MVLFFVIFPHWLNRTKKRNIIVIFISYINNFIQIVRKKNCWGINRKRERERDIEREWRNFPLWSLMFHTRLVTSYKAKLRIETDREWIRNELKWELISIRTCNSSTENEKEIRVFRQISRHSWKCLLKNPETFQFSLEFQALIKVEVASRMFV